MATTVKDDIAGPGHMGRLRSSKRRHLSLLAMAVLVVLVVLGFGVWRVASPSQTTGPNDGYYNCHTDARPWGNDTRGQYLSVTLRHGNVVDLPRAYKRPSPIETKRGSDEFEFTLVELGQYFRGGAVIQRLTFACTAIDFSED